MFQKGPTCFKRTPYVGKEAPMLPIYEASWRMFFPLSWKSSTFFFWIAWHWLDQGAEGARGKFAIEERKPGMNTHRGLRRAELGMVFLLEITLLHCAIQMTSTCFKIRTVCYHEHDHYCNQLLLALADGVSVKVVWYKRCKFCLVFSALSTTEEASHSWGETFGDQKRQRLVFGNLLEKEDPARITQKWKSSICCCKPGPICGPYAAHRWPYAFGRYQAFLGRPRTSWFR